MSPAAAATWLAGPTRALSRSRSAHAMPTTVCSAADCGTGPAPQPQRPRRELGPAARLPRAPVLHELASFRSAETMNELSSETRREPRGSLENRSRQDCLAHKHFCVLISADPGDRTAAYREVRPGPLAAALLSPRPTRRTRCESRGAHGPDRFASRRLRRGATDRCCNSCEHAFPVRTGLLNADPGWHAIGGAALAGRDGAGAWRSNVGFAESKSSRGRNSADDKRRRRRFWHDVCQLHGLCTCVLVCLLRAPMSENLVSMLNSRWFSDFL